MTEQLDYEIITVPGADVPDTIDRIRREQPGIEPVYLGRNGARLMANWNVADMGLTDDTLPTLENLDRFDYDAWVEGEYDWDAEFREVYVHDEEIFGPERPLRGQQQMKEHMDTGKAAPFETGDIGLFKLSEPWHFFSRIPFFDPNSGGLPVYILATHKRWYEKYGARVTTFTPMIIEFTVDRTPAYGAEADEVAKQAYALCGDIVGQGLETVSRLSEHMSKSTVWWFWWD